MKNKDYLSEEKRSRLKALLTLNETLIITYILKDYLKSSDITNAFGGQQKHSYSGAVLPMEVVSSRLKGINNKVKVIKRKAYGFQDLEYFSFVIKDAFANSN